MNRSTLNALRGNPEFPAFAGRVPYSGLTTALLLVLLYLLEPDTIAAVVDTLVDAQGKGTISCLLAFDKAFDLTNLCIIMHPSSWRAGVAPIASILAIKNQPGLKQEGMIVAEDCL